MREVKFRGKNKNTQDWVFGDLIHKRGKTYVGHWAKDDSPSGNGYIECEVIPETIGQYTGLKDCCGKEIYEDDIVEVKDNEGIFFGKIGWSKLDGHFTLEAGNCFTDELCIYIDDATVAGNIFDDFELLEMVE